VATIFNIWSKSQFFRREEQNFIAQNEIDNMALIMPSSGRGGRISATKSDGGASASAKKVFKFIEFNSFKIDLFLILFSKYNLI
jgi:hypothetical protein